MFRSRTSFGLTLGLLFSTSLLVYACGGGGSSSGGGNTSISNASQGSQAASAGTEGAEIGTGLSDIANSLGSIGTSALGKPSLKPVNPLTLKNPKYAKIVAMSNKVAQSKVMGKVAARTKAARMKTAHEPLPPEVEAEVCPDGGSLEGEFTVAASNVSITIDFVNCREEESEMDGQMSLTGSFNETATGFSANLSITLGNGGTPLTLTEYDSPTSSTVSEVLTASLSLSDNLSFDGNDTLTFSLTGNGTAGFEDQSTSETATFTLTNLKNAGSIAGLDAATTTFNNTINGSVGASDGANSMSVTFTNFATTVVDTETSSGSTVDISYNGKVKTDFTPDGCFEGTFTIATETPLRFVDDASCPIDGRFTVNDNMTVQVNSDTSIDVTVGAETLHFDDCDAFSDSCDAVSDFPEL